MQEGSTVVATKPVFKFKRLNQTVQVRSPANNMRTPLRDIGNVNQSQDVTKGTLLSNYTQ